VFFFSVFQDFCNFIPDNSQLEYTQECKVPVCVCVCVCVCRGRGLIPHCSVHCCLCVVNDGLGSGHRLESLSGEMSVLLMSWRGRLGVQL
jgi:hypothetical protein